MSYGREKRFSFVVAPDESVAFRAKVVSRLTSGGVEVTTGDLQSVSASDLVRFRLNAAGDTGISSYTGASGAAGEVVYTDANANTIQEVLDNINGVGVGQTAFNRWRAALGDVPPKYALTAGDLLNQGAVVSTLVGLNHVGVPVYLDSSALAVANEMWVGLGTEWGTKKGGGLFAPDYFEDIPGESTTAGFASNQADRSRTKAKQNDEAVVASVNRVVIEKITWAAAFANNDKIISVFTEDQDPATDPPIYEETYGSANSGDLDGSYGGFRVVGPPGKRLFVRGQGTGAFTPGTLVVTGHYEQSLREGGRS